MFSSELSIITFCIVLFKSDIHSFTGICDEVALVHCASYQMVLDIMSGNTCNIYGNQLSDNRMVIPNISN